MPSLVVLWALPKFSIHPLDSILPLTAPHIFELLTPSCTFNMDLFNKYANQAAGSSQDHPPQQQQGGSDDLLGKLGSFAGGSNSAQQPPQQQSSGGVGGLFDKLHGAVGGGPESEKKEDGLDKGALTSSKKCLAWWVKI